VLDANVLFGLVVRDMLLTLGKHPFRVYTPIWSSGIIAELDRNLRRKLGQPEAKVESLLTAMGRMFPDAHVEPEPAVIQAMPNQQKDRHVLAVAVTVRAPVLVTYNRRDFRGADWLGVRVQDPDEFLTARYDARPRVVRRAVEAQTAELAAPALSVEQFVARLHSVGLVHFAARLRRP
jgi:predicted nucleic acid-binding protein